MFSAGPSLFCGCGRRHAGFTAIELLAVVAVSMLICALGYSAYRTYTVRAEVARGLEVARATASLVTAHLERHHELPGDGVIRSPTVASHPGARLIESVAIERGRVDILFNELANPAISGRQVSLTPYETATMEVVWICGNDVPGPGLSPLGFASGGPQTTRKTATLDPRYLPRECR